MSQYIHIFFDGTTCGSVATGRDSLKIGESLLLRGFQRADGRWELVIAADSRTAWTVE